MYRAGRDLPVGSLVRPSLSTPSGGFLAGSGLRSRDSSYWLVPVLRTGQTGRSDLRSTAGIRLNAYFRSPGLLAGSFVAANSSGYPITRPARPPRFMPGGPAFCQDVQQVRMRGHGCFPATILAQPRRPCRPRHPYAVPRTSLRCVYTRRRNCIEQLPPFPKYALGIGPMPARRSASCGGGDQPALRSPRHPAAYDLNCPF
jgi:hypothetical protein